MFVGVIVMFVLGLTLLGNDRFKVLRVWLV
jgi:hypothetical protein